jgi:hypothetical protein
VGQTTQVASPHENGDVEQRHYRFQQTLDQALMLRGHRDFASPVAYGRFVHQLFDRLNAPRRAQLAHERPYFRPLPSQALDVCQRLSVKVGPSSTIRVRHNVYSVDSRLIGETLDVRVYAERLELWHGQRRVETMPRLRGESQAFIQYRHIIDWLVRKPGAFENYRYRAALFPSSRFRMAYDAFKAGAHPAQAHKHYLQLLQWAADQGERRVDQILHHLLRQDRLLTVEVVESHLHQPGPLDPIAQAVHIDPVDLRVYDALLEVTR